MNRKGEGAKGIRKKIFMLLNLFAPSRLRDSIAFTLTGGIGGEAVMSTYTFWYGRWATDGKVVYFSLHCIVV